MSYFCFSLRCSIFKSIRRAPTRSIGTKSVTTQTKRVISTMERTLLKNISTMVLRLLQENYIYLHKSICLYNINSYVKKNITLLVSNANFQEYHQPNRSPMQFGKIIDNERKKEATPIRTCLTIKTRKCGSIPKNSLKTLEGMQIKFIYLATTRILNQDFDPCKVITLNGLQFLLFSHIIMCDALNIKLRITIP